MNRKDNNVHPHEALEEIIYVTLIPVLEGLPLLSPLVHIEFLLITAEPLLAKPFEFDGDPTAGTSNSPKLRVFNERDDVRRVILKTEDSFEGSEIRAM